MRAGSRPHPPGQVGPVFAGEARDPPGGRMPPGCRNAAERSGGTAQQVPTIAQSGGLLAPAMGDSPSVAEGHISVLAGRKNGFYWAAGPKIPTTPTLRSNLSRFSDRAAASGPPGDCGPPCRRFGGRGGSREGATPQPKGGALFS